MIFTAVILTGGRSQRMGRDKAFIEQQGQSLLARQIELVRKLHPEEVLISGRTGTDYGGFDCPIIHDAFPHRGPLAGIEQALHLARSPLLLVLAVDMPAMMGAILMKLLGECTLNSGVVPRWEDHLEPLAAVYPKTSHRMAHTMLTEGFGAVHQFARLCVEAGLMRFHEISPKDRACFTNWNSPEDISKAQVSPTT